jgi:hypothetical protein
MRNQVHQGEKMKRLGLSVGLAIVFCAAMSALANAAGFSFRTVIFPNDTFTQLLGINDFDVIAGYHGATINKGFVFTPPNHFTDENFPASAQTQVTGINDRFKTAGFYIDTGGLNHGFLRTPGGTFSTVDFPGTKFNQLLGLNFHAQAVGYFADSPGFTLDHAYIYDANGGVFLQIVIPLAVNGSQATGINDQQEVCGFYIDSGMGTHGFVLNFGTLTTLNFPGASSTQALGLNDQGQVVGVYTVGAAMHGFVYNSKHGHFYSVDDPNGVGTTTINGINNFGQIVGFYVDSMKNTDGFIGTP